MKNQAKSMMNSGLRVSNSLIEIRTLLRRPQETKMQLLGHKLTRMVLKTYALLGLAAILASIIMSVETSMDELQIIPDLDLDKCPPLTDNPKRIWAYWHNGTANMSIFVQENIKMWKHMSPNWEIRLLEGSNPECECHYTKFLPKEFIPKDFENGLVQKQSDAIRLGLMRLYGGVYMDATVILFEPLELNFWNHVDRPADDPNKKAMVGYYNRAFSKPNTTNGFEIWMMVAQAQEPLIVAWHNLYMELVKDSMKPFIRNETTMEVNELFNGTDLSYLDESYVNYGASTTCLKALLQLNPEWNEVYVNKSIMSDVDVDAYKVNNYNFFQPWHLYNYYCSPQTLSQDRMKFLLEDISLVKLISAAKFISDDKIEEWNQPYNVLSLMRLGIAKKGKKYRETGIWDNSIWV